jgi:SAM-dependent methyltransferase
MICRVCGSANLDLVVDLGSQPWCNHFLRKEEVGTEPFYPLRVVYCLNCATAQLDYTLKKEIMFGDHTYLSGVTRSLSAHFRQVAMEADARFLQGAQTRSVLDIGSNDGTQLKHFQDLGYDVLGVESSRGTAERANAAGVPTLNEFFDHALACRLGRKFDLVNAAGVFFHLEELHSVTEGIRQALKEDGVFIVQFLYMKSIMENVAFDQIYHEHLLYYNLHTIQRLLNLHGLAMFDCYLAPIHGGSIVGFVTHAGRHEPSARMLEMQRAEVAGRSNDIATYQAFYRRIQQMKLDNLGYLSAARRDGKRIFGFGAPVKGNTLLNHFGVGTDFIDCLVEKNTMRRGLYSPGMHIPVVMEDELSAPPNVYYVLAWNFKAEIINNNQKLLDQGVEFYFPVNPKEDGV